MWRHRQRIRSMWRRLGGVGHCQPPPLAQSPPGLSRQPDPLEDDLPPSREHSSWWLKPAQSFAFVFLWFVHSTIEVQPSRGNDQKRPPRERRAAGWSRLRSTGFLGVQPREKEARCSGVVWRLVSCLSVGAAVCETLCGGRWCVSGAAELWSSLLLLLLLLLLLARAS